MRVSYRWLRELLPSLVATPSEVADRLTRAGLEVEAMTNLGDGLERVAIAAVRRVEPHPSRDRLRLVTVDTGHGEERIVCGAPNVPEPGGLVVFAPVGSRLPAANLVIEPRAIAGVQSAGMLCSEAELGLTDDSDGIVILPNGAATPGKLLSEVVPESSDTIFEIGITPNRPDALGHVGVARDLAALMGIALELPRLKETPRVSSLSIESLLTVEVKEPAACPIYGASVVDGVTIAPSPAWLRYRLHALGVRPISNVVDVTNLVLLELGQPLHAFDHALVAGSRIIVRRAGAEEPFTTLDGVTRKLSADDLVIADADGATALAGVMGGQKSEIRATTSRVIVECAYFEPRGVRRTSRRHALSTESSYRFERGIDWGGTPAALERATALLATLSGGEVVRGSILVRGAPLERPKVRLRAKRLDALLGVHVPFPEATAILERLGFGVKTTTAEDGSDVADVVGASFRPDISLEADLIEEVARIRGLDSIPTVLPAILPQPPRAAGHLERLVLREAANLGLSEAITYAFVSDADNASVGAPEAVVRLELPMSAERSVMRTTLLPGLLEAVKRARRRGEHAARLFTVGARFLPSSDLAELPSRPRLSGDRGVLPEERPSFAAVLAGPRPSHLSRAEDVDVLDAKGLAVELVERITGRTPAITTMATDELPVHLHPRGAAWISVEGTRIGSLGPLHPDVVESLDLGGTAQVVELDLAAVEPLGRPTPRYRPIPRLPATSRDVALVASESVSAASIEGAIRGAAGDLCESVELFDVFSGGNIADGARSLAFHVVYRDPKTVTDPDAARTLTDEEVDQRHERVREAVRSLGELRS
ncbi:MAG TPA: phenylalanine--tRNA ligase subunit beta [Polyangiaceae bacterium]|jgi:phenylalanyl-tRNA synthetase beta chain|nr:phenylalanine--tRNA ligase subunit beta [Polyangiaceae bacterium]